jgi:sulfotransferase
MNLLAQNSDIGVTATSGILELMYTVKKRWEEIPEFQAEKPPEETKIRVMRAVVEAYHAVPGEEKEIVLDKSRGWLGELEMVERVFDRQAKVLVPVRDLRAVLASFEKLYRKSKDTLQPNSDKKNYFSNQTVEGRARTLMQPNNVVGVAYNRIKDAVARGFRDRMLFIDYDRFTQKPDLVIREIYEFLNLAPFTHDFENVEQVTKEDDSIYGYKNLHTIRPKIESQSGVSWKNVMDRDDVKFVEQEACFFRHL